MKLKPCPFCGGKVVRGEPVHNYDFRCPLCGVQVIWAGTWSDVPAMWNAAPSAGDRKEEMA